ncbi:sensor domain-containing diguanylate cyclase [Pelotomaculum terephthalicicum JT]|uniref:sensor domain-containing diguanylate cyclase n=1 Tax=Pelotomaculum TaxID=191373 RepID=UPI0009C777F9|nr:MULTISPECIES: sensor domain-containing diguanylate cyclase [Pelotomaculum]MCG9969568.1 sensor domain-containing diguanylate cyclase [Pelotomaculum terephthalicicum JT]OPX85228.1 MAG: Response regulator PleD [Pelotomaculum sp. PtaB.Bin117]OPY62057.1 MAG: Response regulator PleD [Pelotomaculum sp. PtaU1.Bin065]
MDVQNCQDILENLYDGLYIVDRKRKITFWNKGAEKITGFKSAEVVGSYCWQNLLTHVDSKGTLLCKGMCPLAKTIEDGVMREAEVFLRHKGGYRVPVFIRISPLRDLNGKITGAIEIFNDNSPKIDLVQQIEQLRELSLLDQLTGLANRRYAEIHLQGKIKEMSDCGCSFFGVIFLDIDHFKKVNDEHGHDVGDEVLKMVSMTLKRGVNGKGLVCRWGGEEFIVVIPAGDIYMLQSIAGSLRALVEQSRYSNGRHVVSVTVSAGATMAVPGDTVDSMVKRADALMFRSKKMGRNRVSV